jgi:hypothetical protein
VFGINATESAPWAPNVTLFVPAATASPFAVMNGGHEIKSVPAAGVLSARNTTSLTTVVAGPWPFEIPAISSKKKSRPSWRRASNIIPPCLETSQA